MESGGSIGGVILGLVVLAVLVFVVPRLVGGNFNICTRCRGSGEINERWPDPAAPGGFHVAEGKCPRCKGKGKVKV